MSGWLGAVDPEAARRVAEEILADPRFHPARPPRPFAGFFRRLGELIVDPVVRFFGWIGDHLPEVGTGPWLALAAAVVAAAVVVTLRLSTGRGREHRSGGRRAGGAGGPGPDELERRADDAERRGDLDLALRLRFQAGLARLDASGAVRLRPGLTNRAVSRTLRSPGFDALAADFDEVAYGGRPATDLDVHSARSAWPLVLDDARSRPVPPVDSHPRGRSTGTAPARPGDAR